MKCVTGRRISKKNGVSKGILFDTLLLANILSHFNIKCNIFAGFCHISWKKIAFLPFLSAVFGAEWGVSKSILFDTSYYKLKWNFCRYSGGKIN